MDVFEILNDKSIRKLEARKLIADSISDGGQSSLMTSRPRPFSKQSKALRVRRTAALVLSI